MKRLSIRFESAKLFPMFLSSALLVFTLNAVGQDTKSVATASAPQAQPSQPAPTVASVVDREISLIEKQITEAADAMPEDKFNFSPASLKIAGSEYEGVRTFAGQVKHVAASNYFLWSPLTGDPLPQGLKDGNGPENLKTKAEIMQFLKDSFVLGHKAAATLTTENILQNPGKAKRPVCTAPHLASPTRLITTDRWWSTYG